jgi:predicted dinucleotide-binding enzyme
VIVAVPAYHLTDTIEAVADELDDSVLVSPAVGMRRDEDGLHYNPPSAGSVTALAADAAPESVPAVERSITLQGRDWEPSTRT